MSPYRILLVVSMTISLIGIVISLAFRHDADEDLEAVRLQQINGDFRLVARIGKRTARDNLLTHLLIFSLAVPGIWSNPELNFARSLFALMFIAIQYVLVSDQAKNYMDRDEVRKEKS